ncbi:hypothetical protein N7537_002143 [Penicillium hordei]|uniref:Peptidase S8/S53 domain-containing protein n=1 Tax=Penicillium hordei TaxID=40994 RepID=A0AAD6EGS4_9EURO|nr:uncharacterized protein N7537_002143 [Penicillium hordei]KAJ5617029.1 hypothetical protein N7537_002143 [Penicillium hordei]
MAWKDKSTINPTLRTRISPFGGASDPHGTQMANLICAIDPGCEFYVAKVTEGRHGISLRRVAGAIEWAMSKDVDVISMSFVMLEEFKNLGTVCTCAYEKGIVMLCSYHDQVEHRLEIDSLPRVTRSNIWQLGGNRNRGGFKFTDSALL